MSRSPANIIALFLAGLVLAPIFGAASEDHLPIRRVHARRASANVNRSLNDNSSNNSTSLSVSKRAVHENARATWYDVEVGLGACGVQSRADEFTIALNEEEFGPGYPGRHCFKEVWISHGGRTTNAQIRDMCPTASQCFYGAIDMSVGLFQFFAPLGTGVLSVTWDFVEAGTAPGAPAPAPPPSSSPEPTPTTTSTSETPTSTSTQEPATTSTSTTTTSSALSTTTSSSSSSQSSSSSSVSGESTSGTATGTTSSNALPTSGTGRIQTGSSGDNIGNIFTLAAQHGNLVRGAVVGNSGLGRREL